MNKDGIDFDFDKIEDFQSHIVSSIPGYNLLIESIENISTFFVIPHSNVYDLGCSTGFLIESLANKFTYNGLYFHGYDISENLLPKSHDNKIFICQNIMNKEIEFNNASLILCVFVLQFITINQRIELIKKIYNCLPYGGAFVWAEKIMCDSGQMQEILSFSHYDFKKKAFDSQTILDKQLVLRKIMKPMTDKQNQAIAKSVGFEFIESFWQSLNFKAWIAIK